MRYNRGFRKFPCCHWGLHNQGQPQQVYLKGTAPFHMDCPCRPWCTLFPIIICIVIIPEYRTVFYSTETYYGDIESAFENAQEGDTVTVLKAHIRSLDLIPFLPIRFSFLLYFYIERFHINRPFLFKYFCCYFLLYPKSVCLYSNVFSALTDIFWNIISKIFINCLMFHADAQEYIKEMRDSDRI